MKNQQANQHSKVFFGQYDVAEIRRKTEAGSGALIKAEILRRCETYLKPDHKDYINLKEDRVSLLGPMEMQ